MNETAYRVLMGNEAIARGLIENGCTVAASYPGTPASEILSSLVQMAKEHEQTMHLEWSINEKAAFEVSLSNSWLGRRSAVSMKQVGLNVAFDPLMSAAYTGVKGGFIVVSADDPGPYSSQTEQDSRFLAMSAKIPVFDPSCPQEAKEMVEEAFVLSERFEIPVMLRPTTRVCHARQKVSCDVIDPSPVSPVFQRDPGRWAATPGFRYLLHRELNRKIESIAGSNTYSPMTGCGKSRSKNRGILASGVAFAHVYDLLEDLDLLDQVALYQIRLPYPLSSEFLNHVSSSYDETLVLEETYPLIELQMGDRRNVRGRLDGSVPGEGELSPDIIKECLLKFLKIHREPRPPAAKRPEKGPTLCPGCPHRASFFAIRKALPHAIYCSDIGCYTLGLNLKAVDTFLCMGASINQAAGFYHSFASNGNGNPPIVATIGDSTFFHSGITALANSVLHKAHFVLVILDNHTTAMTGFQATPETGLLADGTQGNAVRLRDLVSACGVRFVKETDPYLLHDFILLLKEAAEYCSSSDGGVAAIIARHPCLLDRKVLNNYKRCKVDVADDCTGCRYCIENFECPALIFNPSSDRVDIDRDLCAGCGVCIAVCPVGAITIKGGQG